MEIFLADTEEYVEVGTVYQKIVSNFVSTLLHAKAKL
jgi:hypothetical protein